MKKFLFLLALLLVSGSMAWAVEPPALSLNDGSDNAINEFRFAGYNQGASLLGFQTINYEESTNFGFDSFSDMSALTKRKKSKAGLVLTIVGGTCIVAGGVVAGICISKLVSNVKVDMEEPDFSDISSMSQNQDDFESRGKSNIGYVLGTAGGGLVFAAGIPLTIVGINLMTRKGGHRRHSELLNGTLSSDMLCTNEKGSNAMLSIGMGSVALQW